MSTASSQLVLSQGNFRNLGFEDANISDLLPNTGAMVIAGDAVPGWTVYVGYPILEEVSEVSHNTITLGSPGVSIYGPHSASEFILQGKYSVILQSGLRSTGFQSAIGQIGTVPGTARSIVFRLASDSLQGVKLTFRGVGIPLGRIGITGFVGGRISEFAGESGELRFTAIPNDTGIGQTDAILDDVRFSPLDIPEPYFVSLLLAGFISFWLLNPTQRH